MGRKWPFLMLAAICFSACGANDSMFVEQKEIKQGSLNGFVIGMDHAQVLTVARNLGARVISPTVCNAFQISKINSAELPALQTIEGIRVTNSQNQFMDIFFLDGRVSKIAQTPGSNIIGGISVGDGADGVRERVLNSLELQDGVSVTPIVDYNDKGPLPTDNFSLATGRDLAAHNCWKFEINSVAPAGAVYVIQFGTTGLQRVLYRRPKIRTE
jgi:hypothetical protein